MAKAIATAVFALAMGLIALQTKANAKLSYQSPLPNRITATRSSGDKPDLVIATYVNFGGSGYALPMGPVCPVGIQMALDAVQDASLLPNYQLVIDAHDDMCDEGHGLRLVADLLIYANETSDNLVPLTVGPTYAENAYTGLLLKFYDFVGLADVSIVTEVYSNRQKYKGFYSVVPSFEMFYEAIPAFIRHMGWTQIYLLTETYSFWTPLEDILHYNLAKQNITLVGTSKVLVHTGGFPAPEQFQLAVRDLAEMDPRIVIVNTNFVSVIPCWLYYYGLYGPKYVFIFFGPSFFLPNSWARSDGCTDEMLAEVLKSVIFYWYGYPINLNPNVTDVMGTTGKYFDETLKEKIEEPEMRDKWYFWRSHCYSETLAAILALNYTENVLQRHNDTLLNWVTTSSNFRRNSSYIQRLIMESLEQLHYNGINAYERDHFNSRKSVTGFVQMQQDPSRPVTTLHDLTASFDTVPVASYDSAVPNPRVANGPGKFHWRTFDGHIPYDTLRVFPIAEPLLGKGAIGALSGISAALILVNLIIFVIRARMRSQGKVTTGLKQMNLLIQAGLGLIAIFVLILPVDGAPDSSSHCIAASFVLLAGLSLYSAAMATKLHYCYKLCPKFGLSSGVCMTTSTAVPALAGGRRSSRTSAACPVAVPRSGRSVGGIPVTSLALSWRMLLFVPFYVAIQVALLALWFGLEPPLTEKIIGQLEGSRQDFSIAYQHYTYGCKLLMGSNTANGILITMSICYILLVLRSLHIACLLKSCQRTASFYKDATMTRIASYVTALSVAAGGGVIFSFFSGDVAVLEIAVSCLAIIVVFANTAFLFPQTTHI